MKVNGSNGGITNSLFKRAEQAMETLSKRLPALRDSLEKLVSTSNKGDRGSVGDLTKNYPKPSTSTAFNQNPQVARYGELTNTWKNFTTDGKLPKDVTKRETLLTNLNNISTTLNFEIVTSGPFYHATATQYVEAIKTDVNMKVTDINNRFGQGFYVTDDKSTAIKEICHHTNKPKVEQLKTNMREYIQTQLTSKPGNRAEIIAATELFLKGINDQYGYRTIDIPKFIRELGEGDSHSTVETTVSPDSQIITESINLGYDETRGSGNPLLKTDSNNFDYFDSGQFKGDLNEMKDAAELVLQAEVILEIPVKDPFLVLTVSEEDYLGLLKGKVEVLSWQKNALKTLKGLPQLNLNQQRQVKLICPFLIMIH